MSKNYSDNTKCPICLEVPAAEIYQCVNGHPLCSSCAGRVEICPSCRIKLDSPKIRNRIAETILDRMTFECEHKGAGCREKLLRAEILSHSKQCVFGGIRVQLCKLLGFSCEYLACDRRVIDLAEHLRDAHHGTIVDGLETTLKLEARTVSQTKFIWRPLCFISENDYICIVLLHVSLNKTNETAVFNCIQISDNSTESNENSWTNHSVKFFIESRNLTEAPHISWIYPTYDLQYAEFTVKHLAHRIPYDVLFKYLLDGSVSVVCKCLIGGKERA